MRIICRGRYRRRFRRRATALLVCIFVIAITTVIVVSMIDAQTLRMRALRNTQDYEQALYLAGAAAHHAISQLEADPELAPPFSVGPVEFPVGSGSNYQADVAAASNDAVITASGTSGEITRYLRVTISQNQP